MTLGMNSSSPAYPQKNRAGSAADKNMDCTEKNTIISRKDPEFALAFAGFFLYTKEAVTLIA